MTRNAVKATPPGEGGEGDEARTHLAGQPQGAVTVQSLIFDDCLYREKQICRGDKGSPPIIPVSHSTWWKGIQDGVFPQGIKLSAGVTVWRGSDLRKVVEGKWQGSA